MIVNVPSGLAQLYLLISNLPRRVNAFVTHFFLLLFLRIGEAFVARSVLRSPTKPLFLLSSLNPSSICRTAVYCFIAPAYA